MRAQPARPSIHGQPVRPIISAAVTPHMAIGPPCSSAVQQASDAAQLAPQPGQRRRAEDQHSAASIGRMSAAMASTWPSSAGTTMILFASGVAS